MAICIIVSECVDLHKIQWRKWSHNVSPKHPKESKNTKLIFFINPNYIASKDLQIARCWDLTKIYYMDRPLLVALLLLLMCSKTATQSWKKVLLHCESMKTTTATTLVTICLSKGGSYHAEPAPSTLCTYWHVFDFCPTIPSHLSFSQFWNLNLPQLLLWLLYLAWQTTVRVINSTLMARHGPWRRKTQTKGIRLT